MAANPSNSAASNTTPMAPSPADSSPSDAAKMSVSRRTSQPSPVSSVATNPCTTIGISSARSARSLTSSAAQSGRRRLSSIVSDSQETNVDEARHWRVSVSVRVPVGSKVVSAPLSFRKTRLSPARSPHWSKGSSPFSRSRALRSLTYASNRASVSARASADDSKVPMATDSSISVIAPDAANRASAAATTPTARRVMRTRSGTRFTVRAGSRAREPSRCGSREVACRSYVAGSRCRPRQHWCHRRSWGPTLDRAGAVC